MDKKFITPKEFAMRAYSINIGLNAVDATHYLGWPGILDACENDARDMATIAARQGFASTNLLTRQATSSRLLQLLGAHAAALTAGDTLLITFAGHGAQVPDRNGDEADRLDETWVLYDRMLLDDELHAAMTRFRAGVRVIVVADSCHSGTSARLFAAPVLRPRRLSGGMAKAVCNAHEWTYRHVRDRANRNSPVLQSSVLLLSACQDHQLAADGPTNGLFTGTLKQVWNKGAFVGDYAAFVRRVRDRMPRNQQPGLSGFGSAARSIALERPFAKRAAATLTPVPSPA
jgi:metacaspase-1